MTLTETQKQAIFAALDQAAAATSGADEATRAAAQQQSLVAAAGGLPLAAVVPVLREYGHRLQMRQRGSQRVARAMEAVIVEMERAGVATPGELLTKRGLTSMAELLGSLGFTGDLNALAKEMEAALRQVA